MLMPFEYYFVDRSVQEAGIYGEILTLLSRMSKSGEWLVGPARQSEASKSSLENRHIPVKTG